MPRMTAPHPIARRRTGGLAFAFSLGAALQLPAQAPGPAPTTPPPRDLDAATEPWRTVRSGEGFRATVFGEPRTIAARDRRSVSAWTAGVAMAPHADESAAWPFGSLYFWNHELQRDTSTQLLRAVIAGAYNELLFRQGAATPGGGEWLATFSSYTPPWSSGELIDGELPDQEKVHWGYLRPGVGFAFPSMRELLGAEQDNLLASMFVVEPGLLYFGRADRTAGTFALPDSTFELRARWHLRVDALERNLLELPHRGFAAGADAIYGNRAQWDTWGLPGTETHDGHSGRDYATVAGYLFAIGDVPGARDDRWRLCASLHAGAGDSVDRFSATRVGGGPDLRGEEWDTSARPLLPGSAVGEFYPDRYAVGSLSLRRELTFFTFVDFGATVATLDRDRETTAGRMRECDTLTAVQTRLTTGFLGNTRLLVDYAYGFDVVRAGERGGHEIVVQVSGRF